MSHALPELPYDYGALEPYIDEQTMRIHHTKHHQTYVDKLNAALEGMHELQALSVEDLVRNINVIPENIRTAVRNHGGGHANHSFFWPVMAPEKTEPINEIANAIATKFGSFDKFKELFTQSAANLFGSGWAWLVVSNEDRPAHGVRQLTLEIMTTPNQDSPLSHGKVPVLGLDLWEHAFYLKYQNRKADYIAAWWNVVNWDKVNEHFTAVIE